MAAYIAPNLTYLPNNVRFLFKMGHLKALENCHHYIFWKFFRKLEVQNFCICQNWKLENLVWSHTTVSPSLSTKWVNVDGFSLNLDFLDPLTNRHLSNTNALHFEFAALVWRKTRST